MQNYMKLHLLEILMVLCIAQTWFVIRSKNSKYSKTSTVLYNKAVLPTTDQYFFLFSQFICIVECQSNCKSKKRCKVRIKRSFISVAGVHTYTLQIDTFAIKYICLILVGSCVCPRIFCFVSFDLLILFPFHRDHVLHLSRF